MPAQPRPFATPPSEAGDGMSQEEIVRSLIRQFNSNGTASATGELGGGEEILVDIELDGWRYMLIRAIPPSNPLVQLSPREQEIVRMVAAGHPNKVIAAVLNISSWTVGTHLRRIFAKLGVGSRAAMVARYMGIGNEANQRPTDAQNAATSAYVRRIK